MSLRFAAVLALTSTASAAGVLLVAGPQAARPAERAQGPEDVAVFVERVVNLIAQNRYAEAWPSLHPEQRRVAGLEAYVACEQLSPILGKLESVAAGAAVDEPALLAPGRLVPSKAVAVRIALRDVATAERTVVNATVHAIDAGGRWTWILPASRLAHYAAGRCPGAPPPRPDAASGVR